MFFVKFLENVFSSGLKDKPGPSFVATFVVCFLIVNNNLIVEFLKIKGDLTNRLADLLSMNLDVSYWGAFFLALAITILKPAFNNLGLVSREAADKGAQIIIQKWKIKAYRTEAEYKVIQEQKADWEDKYVIARGELAAAKNKITESEVTLKEYIDKTQNLENQRDNATTLLNNAKKELEEFKINTGVEAASLRKAWDSEREMLEVNLTTVESKLDEVKTKVTSLESQNSNLNQERSNERAKRNVLIKDNDLMVIKIKDLTKQVHDLTTQLSAKDNEVSMFKNLPNTLKGGSFE